MAEQLLDDPDVGAALERGRCKRGTHQVRVDVHADPCCRRPGDRLPDVGVAPAGHG